MENIQKRRIITCRLLAQGVLRMGCPIFKYNIYLARKLKLRNKIFSDSPG